MSVSFTVSRKNVATIFFTNSGKQYIVDESHPNHTKIIDKLKKNDFVGLEKLTDVVKTITKYSNGKVTVENGVVMFGGKPVHNYVCGAILEGIQNGFNVGYLINFLEKLMKNPSMKSVDSLFRFLEANKHPIMADGRFIAYKKVRDDYKDVHSGKFDNSPGKIVEMPRNQVEDDPNKTCSPGLHVASFTYADEFASGKMIVVAVDPSDVVSVPTDYNNSKMRTCKYEVLCDYKGLVKQEEIVSSDDGAIDWDDDSDFEDDDDFEVEVNSDDCYGCKCYVG